MLFSHPLSVVWTETEAADRRVTEQFENGQGEGGRRQQMQEVKSRSDEVPENLQALVTRRI